MARTRSRRPSPSDRDAAKRSGADAAGRPATDPDGRAAAGATAGATLHPARELIREAKHRDGSYDSDHRAADEAEAEGFRVAWLVDGKVHEGDGVAALEKGR